MFKKFVFTIVLLFCTKLVHASNIGVSFVDSQGNSISRSINVDATINLEQEKSEQEIKGGLLYGENDKEVTSRYWFFSLRDEHELIQEPFYWLDFIKFESDPFAGYDLKLSLSLGCGVKFKNDFHEFKIEGGPGIVFQELEDQDDVFNYYAVYRAYEKYKININDRISLFEEGEYTRDIEDSYNYRANGEVGVIGKITETISVKIGPKIRYVNHPVPGKKRTDLITSASIIFSF